MKKLLLLLLCVPLIGLSQTTCSGRYQTEIFNSVSVTTVNYSDVFSDNAHKMDIYTPDGDTVSNRPVILYLHGGSFYVGDKSNLDCVDFCTSMAKRGYVAVSINYRLANIITFLSSTSAQYEAILKSVADAKAAVRYFRKDFTSGDTYGIDTSTIFIGGYSAGAITSLHLAYVDDISDLPTSPINVQNLANNLGGIEGDAGNFGYNSSVQGIVSFAGAIHDLNWIDSLDEPLVSVHGKLDVVVPYNCSYFSNNPQMTMCGPGAIHPVTDVLGLYNDLLAFNGVDHTWAASGNTNPLFVDAINFSVNFLYSILPCTFNYGCTDSTALNYDSLATIDDGSCMYSCGPITGVYMSDVIHDRATFNWDDMNSATCNVDQIRIRYREVGTSSYSNKTMGAPVGSGCNTANTYKRVLGLSASTQYEYDFKMWYCGATTINWHSGGTFTTAPVCDNVINISATPVNTTKTTFCWDSVSTYSFVRLQYRENVPGSTFSNIGGFGVFSPTLCKDKNGLTPGTQYRVMWRTWCNASGGPYRSPVWDGPVIWDQPSSIRVEGGTTINNLEIYPNPSRDVFNVTFTSDSKQSIEVRVVNLVGEIIFIENLEDFDGEYTHSFNLSEYSKGVYLLELDTDNGIVNKKLILQ